MRKRRFSEEQIIAILKESEAGVAIPCRRHNSRGSLYRWKAKHGGMEVREARRLRQLEEENRQLKHTVAGAISTSTTDTAPRDTAMFVAIQSRPSLLKGVWRRRTAPLP